MNVVVDFKFSVGVACYSVVTRVFLTDGEKVLLATIDLLMTFLKDSNREHNSVVSFHLFLGHIIARHWSHIYANCASISLYRLPHSCWK